MSDTKDLQNRVEEVYKKLFDAESVTVLEPSIVDKLRLKPHGVLEIQSGDKRGTFYMANMRRV